MAGSSIIICGQRYDVGRRVVTFEDDPLFSAYTLHRTDKPSEIYPFQPAKGLGGMAARYRERRLIGSDRSLARLQQVLRQFVVHHDGCRDSKTCFQVLHNERGLSVHFLIDNDGTIYQTLDLVDCGFQAAGVNEISVGVELANRGDAVRFPDEYKGHRDKLTCSIHGHQFLAYSYTKDQIDSMSAIGRTMARLFPNLPQSYPLAGSGDPLWTAIADPREYQGWLGHYHVTQQKWDPGPFDFKSFVSTIRGRSVFPLVLPRSAEGNEPATKPDIPDEKEKAQQIADGFYDNNEVEGEGGYFPIGPMGQSRLWHGGIHVRADRGTPLFAPFAGKVVAARVAPPIGIGSRSFVLLRHEIPVAGGAAVFFTLYFHLDEETGGASADPLLRAPAWWDKVRTQLGDDAISLSVDVTAGELVGHVGEAGAPGRLEGQVHIEIFSAEEVGEKLDPGYWQAIDGTTSGRFCNDPFIVNAVDRADHGKRDGLLSRGEMLAFYRTDERRKQFRKLAVRHVSEWADENDWMVQLNRSRDFAGLPKATRARLYKDQIEPVLWWSDEIQNAAGLPADKLVWTYHPITFILWLNEKQHGGGPSQGITAASTFAGQAPPTSIMDDRDATEGFTDDEDALFGEAAKKLELEDLAKGYPEDQPPKKH